jgi:hypothetical protein
MLADAFDQGALDGLAIGRGVWAARETDRPEPPVPPRSDGPRRRIEGCLVAALDSIFEKLEEAVLGDWRRRKDPSTGRMSGDFSDSEPLAARK